MTRQRSRSTSSMACLAKSPSSLTASLSTSVALYDNRELPRSLQDILLLAQSHYISHRYVPALTLYKLAAEQHHSLPACCSLYALYTSTLNVPGLVKSDAKATHALIHALRIWSARRWSLSRLDKPTSARSKIQDDHDELEEYFAHAKQTPWSKKRSVSSGTASIPIRSPTGSGSRRADLMAPLSESAGSEYRSPRKLEDSNISIGQEESDSEDESGTATNTDEDSAEDSAEEELDEEDDELAKEEEARRIGLATSEMEDFVQKLCLMIQKGTLGLDEPILVEAVDMLRRIERGLAKEAASWKVEQERSQSLFGSTLSNPQDNSARTTQTGLLLTQGMDLSFLQCSPEDHPPLVSAQPLGRPLHPPQPPAQPPLDYHLNPANPAISKLSLREQQTDRAFCRAIRIRTMFTLGWVHQQKGEYQYGAQAYGVCSEIVPRSGKRILDSLQQEATVQKFTCRAFEKRALEQALAEEEARRKDFPTRRALSPSPSRPSQPSGEGSFGKSRVKSCSSSIYTSSDTSMTHHRPDISSPSSLSSSESREASMRGYHAQVQPSQSTTFSSLSAAIWNSGLTKSPPRKEKSFLSLRRSKSVTHGSKGQNTLDALTLAAAAVEIKDPTLFPNLSPRPQDRNRESHAGVSAPVLTMSGHQNKAVPCGHCGQRRVLMPLCVCKKVRYCNRECRIADMDSHRETGCHAASLSSSLSLGEAFSPTHAGVAL